VVVVVVVVEVVVVVVVVEVVEVVVIAVVVVEADKVLSKEIVAEAIEVEFGIDFRLVSVNKEFNLVVISCKEIVAPVWFNISEELFNIPMVEFVLLAEEFAEVYRPIEIAVAVDVSDIFAEPEDDVDWP